MNAPVTPPAAIEAEQSVLGALMLTATSLDRFEWLEAKHFYQSAHRLIYASCRRLIEHGKQPDILLVASDLTANGVKDEDYGGLAYLGNIVQSTPSHHNSGRYAEIVREKSVRRELIAKATEVIDEAFHPNIDPLELAERTEAAFLSILQPESAQDTVSLLAAVDSAMEAEQRNEKGIPTGYDGIDTILDGLRKEELVVIAGRPGMGKSSLALGIAEHVAATLPVYLWTGEMSSQQVGKRSLAWHRANLSEDDALNHIASLRLEIDAQSPMSIGTLRLRLRRFKRKHGLGLLVVDYLQLLMGPKFADSRNQEVGAVSRGLKAIAKEFCIPVIVLSSLNRAVESRADKRPVMSDLRESGDIESDADVVAMIYRDKEYNPDSHWGDVAEFIVRKHREGGTGMAMLEWRAEQTRFRNYYGDRPSAPAAEREERQYAPRKPRLYDGKAAAAGAQ